MLENLGDIFEHIRDTLLQGEIDDISEVIEYLEEGQQIIANKYPIEAPIYSVTLTTNEITLPADFKKLKCVKHSSDGEDYLPIEPDEAWAGILYLPTAYVEGTCKLYYYKKPTTLDMTDLSQVPDINPLHYPALADYAAQRYYLADNDTEMVREYQKRFVEGLIDCPQAKNIKSKFKNVW